MKRQSRLSITRTAIALALGSTLLAPARADIVVDWNEKANQWIAESRLGTPPAIRGGARAPTAPYAAGGAARARARGGAAVGAAPHPQLNPQLNPRL